MFIQIFYFVLMVLVNVSTHFETNLYPLKEEEYILSNPNEVHDRIIGSKIVVGLEQCMLMVIWGVKLCVWAFLLRLQ